MNIIQLTISELADERPQAIYVGLSIVYSYIHPYHLDLSPQSIRLGFVVISILAFPLSFRRVHWMPLNAA